MATEPCDGDNMWRRTEGCQSPATATRQPGGDLPCNATPGTFASGYCDCKDKIPRHFGCNDTKKPCRIACAEPPPVSTLSAAFGGDSPASSHGGNKSESESGSKSQGEGGKDAAPPPWWRKHVPALVVTGVSVLLLVLHHFTIPVKTERKALEKLISEQRRRIAFDNRMMAPTPGKLP